MTVPIHKYEITPDQNPVPAGRVLKAAFQHGKVVVWILEEAVGTQQLVVMPTGARVDPNELDYLDTIITPDGMLVLHIFRRVA